MNIRLSSHDLCVNSYVLVSYCVEYEHDEFEIKLQITLKNIDFVLFKNIRKVKNMITAKDSANITTIV